MDVGVKENTVIPEGYKKTEIGIIPEDWEVKRSYELGKIITGSTPSTKIEDYWNGNISWVTPTDIINKKNIYTTERKITE
jgi:type I restriction enzyme S subunit